MLLSGVLEGNALVAADEVHVRVVHPAGLTDIPACRDVYRDAFAIARLAARLAAHRIARRGGALRGVAACRASREAPRLAVHRAACRASRGLPRALR